MSPATADDRHRRSRRALASGLGARRTSRVGRGSSGRPDPTPPAGESQDVARRERAGPASVIPRVRCRARRAIPPPGRGSSGPLVSGKHGSKTHQTSEGVRVAARLSARSVPERAAAHSVRRRASRGRDSRRWTRRRGSSVVCSDDDLGLRRASRRSQLVSSPPRSRVHHLDSCPYRPRARALTDAAGGATTTSGSRVTAEHRPKEGFGAATTPQAQEPESHHKRNPATQGRRNSPRRRGR